jgi:hypothetical protein
LNLFMADNQKAPIQSRILRVTRVHFSLSLVLVLSIIIFDAWGLIAPENVLQRWTIAAFLFVVNTIVWYLSRSNFKSAGYYKALIFALILVDIAVATFLVYNERGMASSAVMLYAIPITTSGILNSRRGLFATAAFSTAAYTLAAVRYFVINFNEGYKVELYGIITFYSALFFVLAALLWVIIGSNSSTDSKS